MKHFLLSLSLAVNLLGISSSVLAGTEQIVFIVHAQTPVESLSKAEIRDFYFKRKRQWPNGTQVRFIDRSPHSPLRQIFLSSILDKTNEEVELFWIGQKLYSGDNAPIKQASESLTIQFVASMPGAIGYISPNTVINNKGVKAIKVEDAEL